MIGSILGIVSIVLVLYCAVAAKTTYDQTVSDKLQESILRERKNK